MKYLLIALLLPVCAWADGGAILAREKIGNLNATIFASPAPLQAGPVDVSVLLQDEKGNPVLDADVSVSWIPAVDGATPEWLPPCCSMNQKTPWQTAIRAHSKNKLLYSAMVTMANSGESAAAIHVRYDGEDAELRLPVQVKPPSPPAWTYWPLLALPPFAIGVFSIHQRITHRHQGSGKRSA